MTIDAKSLDNTQNSRWCPYQLFTTNGTVSGLFRWTLAESIIQKTLENRRFQTFTDVGGT